jgi:hypothetical protein
MDSIRASEAPDSGSIPDEVTREILDLWIFDCRFFKFIGSPERAKYFSVRRSPSQIWNDEL